MTLTDLERRFPEITWREPIPVRLLDDDREHFACRICIAQHGMRGRDIPDLPTDADAVRDHIKREHVE